MGFTPSAYLVYGFKIPAHIAEDLPIEEVCKDRPLRYCGEGDFSKSWSAYQHSIFIYHEPSSRSSYYGAEEIDAPGFKDKVDELMARGMLFDAAKDLEVEVNTEDVNWYIIGTYG